MHCDLQNQIPSESQQKSRNHNYHHPTIFYFFLLNALMHGCFWRFLSEPKLKRVTSHNPRTLSILYLIIRKLVGSLNYLILGFFLWIGVTLLVFMFGKIPDESDRLKWEAMATFFSDTYVWKFSDFIIFLQNFLRRFTTFPFFPSFFTTSKIFWQLVTLHLYCVLHLI